MMRPFLPLTLLLGLLSAESCLAQAPAPAFARTPSGIEYRLFRKDAKGRYQPRPLAPSADAPYASRAGQMLTLFLQYRTGRDSVVLDTRRMQAVAKPQPQPFPLPAQPMRGSLEEALTLLLPGDSAHFRFQGDSLFTKTFHQPVPAFIQRSGNVLNIYASAHELVTQAQLTARQYKQEDDAILAYLKSKKATARKTPGGTYYLVTRAGSGPLPQKGQTVSVLYRGTILSTGKEFDASAKHGNQPFSFVLGQGQVIQGWDQGVAMLPKGSKAVLYIPSRLGYGARGAGADIPPNAVLRFEVEVTDVK
jgi:FKBP-type peptidyl-prolyl cis-trans isomerase FkpA